MPEPMPEPMTEPMPEPMPGPMPERNLDALLDTVVATVLETMFFSETSGETSPESDAGSPRLAAALTFRGCPSGELALAITTAAMRPLAAGFLGEDEADLPERQVGEMACELANMLCGSMVSHLETQMSFDLGSPLLMSPEVALAPRAGRTARKSWAIDRGTLTVVLSLDAGA